jgi:hypothetical protein
MSKLINFNKDYKYVLQSINGAVSSLQGKLPAAIKQQCWIHSNGNVSADDIAEIQPAFNAAITDFYSLMPMVEDMVATQAGELTIEDLAAKYSVDVAQYDSELEDEKIDWT